MAAKSPIEWTDDTWNPIAGCSVVSPGCTNCYAMRRVAPRLAGNPATPQYHGTVQKTKAGQEASSAAGTGGNKKYVWTGKIGIAGDRVFLKPLRTKKPTMYFVNSVSDLFHENVPDEVIDRIFAVMALCPQHTFQVLTKRAKRMREYLLARRIGDPWAEAADWIADITGCEQHPAVLEPSDIPLPNVWLGVSVEDQTRADERIPDLLATPAAIRFISAEPLLGPVDFYHTSAAMPIHDHPWKNGPILQGIHWVIVGGESGSGARPMHPSWARSIRDQCKAARGAEAEGRQGPENGVPFFFKQWGEWLGGKTEDYGDSVIFEAASRTAHDRFLKDADRFDWFEPETAPDGFAHLWVGKKAAGRHLDGIEHNGMPEVDR